MATTAADPVFVDTNILVHANTATAPFHAEAQAALRSLAASGAEIEEGPVERVGGRRQTATSVYVRDPDGNLLEFMIYGTGAPA